MKLSSFVVGIIFAVAVIAVVLLVFGVSFQRPLNVQGAALYNPANEMVVKGTVTAFDEFTCPVGEQEVGSHLILDTSSGPIVVHLAPARIMRSQQFAFAVGDRLEIVGAKFRFRGENSLIAREITRGNETFLLRDHDGKLLLVQR